jgi:tetratricopeptide (TPR) repeat protein
MRAQLSFTLLIFLLAFARPSAASDESDAKRKERAFDLVKAAIALQDDGQHDLALEPLNEALALFDHHKILFYKARSLTALERWQAAYEVWDRLMGSKALKGEQREEVQQGWARAKAEIKRAKRRKAAASAKEVSPVAVKPAAPPHPTEAHTEASNDLSGSVEVKEQRRGPSTTAWVLIGTGAAAVVGGGLAAILLLRDGGSSSPKDNDTWVLQ